MVQHSFQEVMQQWDRMCESTDCDECPLYVLDDEYTCTKSAKRNPEKAKEIIMRWAAENPEPKCVTLQQALELLGFYVGIGGEIRLPDRASKQPIPADIAEKLGIEPKEG